MPKKKNFRKPAHYKVYARLKPSEIHGVGVFAIRSIPKNTSIFCDEAEQNMEDLWVDKKDIEKLDPEIKKLYEDFCVIENGKYSCPNFDLLTVGWYVNHSSDPNVKQNESGSFITLRNIKKGEEITADYKTYSDEPEREWLQ